MPYQLKMLGNLRDYLPPGQGKPGQGNHCTMALPPEHTIAEAITALALPISRPYYVILNGEKLPPEAYANTLQDGDELVLFPPIKGG